MFVEDDIGGGSNGGGGGGVVVLVAFYGTTASKDTNMMVSTFLNLYHDAHGYLPACRSRTWPVNHHHQCSRKCTLSSSSQYSLGLGEYHVELRRPLGVILEERQQQQARDTSVPHDGVIVKEIIKGSSAWNSGIIAPGDVLQRINDMDVSRFPFEQIMDLLVVVDVVDDDTPATDDGDCNDIKQKQQ